MSAENKIHITVLEPEGTSFRSPEYRCLQLSTPMDLEGALKVAGRFTELLPQNKGLAFIEEERVKATKEIQCEFCNDRSTRRQDLEYLVSELSSKTTGPARNY